MILITSAAFLDQELGAEFGRIPPAFLPIGNKRLFTYQVKELPKNETIYLTIPKAYILNEHDTCLLKELSIKVLRLPEGIGLGQSILFALDLIDFNGEPLKILHGDTLLGGINHKAMDIIAVSEVDDNYNWAIYCDSGEKTLIDFVHVNDTMKETYWVANGYFSFSNTKLFIESIQSANGDFIQGINNYSAKKKLGKYKASFWHDFGHVHTYFRSKSHVTTQREFNNIEISDKTVKKTSYKKNKMKAEANWLSGLPNNLKLYAPHFISHLDEGYEIEYLHYNSLSELYVFGMLPVFVWKKILNACFEFLDECSKHKEEKEKNYNFKENVFCNKTKTRLSDFSKSTSIDLHQKWRFNGKKISSIESILSQTESYLPSLNESQRCISHGDFCFSNILYDSRSQSIKVIDPRGCDYKGDISLYGEQLYDIAKISHSILGMYDFIIAKNYKLIKRNYDIEFHLFKHASVNKIQNTYVQMLNEKYALTQKNLNAMQIQLFLSMLPLHKDDVDRQNALLANAFRLYAELDWEKK